MPKTTDPYVTLGLSRGVDQEEVRRAYRRLAKKFHPDLHPGDLAAEQRFKEVPAAYALLGDPDKRVRFDRGEIDASGAERPDHEFYRHHAETSPGSKYHRYGSLSEAGEFDEVDVARVRLFCEQRSDLEIGEESFSLIVSLIDQLYGTRRTLKAFTAAVEAQPAAVRARIATLVKTELKGSD